MIKCTSHFSRFDGTQLEFNDTDIAFLFLAIGSLGVFVQGVVLKVLNDAIGERRVIAFSFFMGGISNFLYGFASSKTTIFIGAMIGSLVNMSFPCISAMKANNVVRISQLSFYCPINFAFSHSSCFVRMKLNRAESKEL